MSCYILRRKLIITRILDIINQYTNITNQTSFTPSINSPPNLGVKSINFFVKSISNFAVNIIAWFQPWYSKFFKDLNFLTILISPVSVGKTIEYIEIILEQLDFKTKHPQYWLILIRIFWWSQNSPLQFLSSNRIL